MTLLFISFFMSILIVLITMFRKISKNKISSKIYYYLWIIIVIRLILPFDFSLKNSVNVTISKNSGKISETIERDIDKAVTAPFVGENQNVLNEEINTSIGEENFQNIPIYFTFSDIWKVGMILYFSINILSYYHYRKKVMSNTYVVDRDTKNIFEELKLKLSVNRKVDIKISESVYSPQLIGVFSPTILIPGRLNSYDLQYIITHELIHFKRGDILYKLLLLIAKGVHWFNPIVHFMSRMASEDIELSCDEEVLEVNEANRGEYSNCLLDLSSKSIEKDRALIVNYAGGAKFMKKRIDNIFEGAKKSPKYLIVLLIMVIGLGGLLVGCEKRLTLDDLMIDMEDVVEDELSYYQEVEVKEFENSELKKTTVNKMWYEYVDDDNFNYKSYFELDNGEEYINNYADGVNTIYNENLNQAVIFDTKKDIESVLDEVRDDLEGTKKVLKENSVKRHLVKFLNDESENTDYEIIGNKKIMNRDSIGLKMTPKGNTDGKHWRIFWVDTETWIILGVDIQTGEYESITETVVLDLEPKFENDDFTVEFPDDVEIKKLTKPTIK